MNQPTPEPEINIPHDETPVSQCQYCDRPFQSERASALHLGEVHAGECTAEEKTAYEEAKEAERDDLFYFHMKVVVALGSIYGITILAYMIALGSGLL